MIGIGVIGYGYWGPNLVRNFADVSSAKLAMVSDLNPQRLAEVQRRFPNARVTPDASALITDPSVDAVAIATPVSTHFQLALGALRAGKHVLVEKPLAMTSDQCQRLIDEAEAQNRVLMVDHTFLYTGAVRRIKELVNTPEFGEVQYYDSTRVNLGLFQHDVSVLWDLAVHDLSIMDHVLASEARAVSATGISHVSGQPENTAYLTLYFDSRTIARLHVNWLAPVKIRRTLIGGSKQMVVYDDLEPSEKVKIYDKGITINDSPQGVYQMRIGYRTGDMWAPQLDGAEALKTELSHFCDCIAKGHTPISDGWSGLRVVEILEAATRSMAEKGRPVELPRRRATAPLKLASPEVASWDLDLFRPPVSAAPVSKAPVVEERKYVPDIPAPRLFTPMFTERVATRVTTAPQPVAPASPAPTNIPFVDLKAQYASIKHEVEPVVERVLASGGYVLGAEVTEFEKEFASYCRSPHAISLNTGTSALHLALLAAGIGEGDEVITTPHTFVATVAAIRYTGAKPVFVDIDPVSYTIDHRRMEQVITPRTKAIIPVHIYGHPCDMDPIMEIARRHKLVVIEDACQAHGAEYHGRRCGSIGDFGCFSFYPGKNLGACGEGGAVVTSRDDYAKTMRMLRDWGAEQKYHHVLKGYNYRLDALQAAILRVKLRHLEKWTEARRRHAHTYQQALANSGLGLPQEMAACRHVYHVYAVRTQNRSAIQQALQTAGVNTGIHYPIPVHMLPAHADLGHRAGDFPHAERAASEVLSLPMYAELPAIAADIVSRVVSTSRHRMVA